MTAPPFILVYVDLLMILLHSNKKEEECTKDNLTNINLQLQSFEANF